jgi:hypothetical protein
VREHREHAHAEEPPFAAFFLGLNQRVEHADASRGRWLRRYY